MLNGDPGRTGLPGRESGHTRILSTHVSIKRPKSREDRRGDAKFCRARARIIHFSVGLCGIKRYGIYANFNLRYPRADVSAFLFRLRTQTTIGLYVLFLSDGEKNPTAEIGRSSSES